MKIFLKIFLLMRGFVSGIAFPGVGFVTELPKEGPTFLMIESEHLRVPCLRRVVPDARCSIVYCHGLSKRRKTKQLHHRLPHFFSPLFFLFFFCFSKETQWQSARWRIVRTCYAFSSTQTSSYLKFLVRL